MGMRNRYSVTRYNESLVGTSLKYFLVPEWVLSPVMGVAVSVGRSWNDPAGANWRVLPAAQIGLDLCLPSGIFAGAGLWISVKDGYAGWILPQASLGYFW